MSIRRPDIRLHGTQLVLATLVLAAWVAAPAAEGSVVRHASGSPLALDGHRPSTEHIPEARSGGRIVFHAELPSGPHQIYLENADGTNPHRLVTSGFDDQTPSLSPDGRTVAFSRLSLDGISQWIYLVDVDGTGLHQIDVGGCVLPCLAEGVEGDAWSPDGTELAIFRALVDETGQVANVGLWTLNINTGQARQLTMLNMAGGAQDDRAGWSPDGTHLVFERIEFTSPERSAIFTIRADGTDLRRVTPWALNANDPDWSPDGRLIAFQSPAEANSGGEQNIYTIHPDGTGLKQLTDHLSTYPDGSEGTFHPSWSPSGKQLVFSHNPSTGGRADLFVMNRDGSRLHLLAPTELNENAAHWGRSPQ
jgi:Tol biopolymer transport system component